MNTAEQQRQSEPSTGSQDLAVLRASLRCGRSLPVLHLVEADDTLMQQWWWLRRARVAVCGAEITESTPVPDYEDCPGCRDCMRYCLGCVREAQRWSVEASPAGDEPDFSG